MKLKLPETTRQIRWVDLLTQYKYRPSDLLCLIESKQDIREVIETGLISTLQSFADWPVELLDWRLVLVALMENEIGDIMSPYLRTASHDELLCKGREWGITPTALRMISTEIDSVYKRLKDQSLRLPWQEFAALET
jgi:hypothetical protein